MRKGVIILALALVVLARIASANSAPLISHLDKEIIVCESSRFSLQFDVAELDEDSLTVGISPSGPFFVRPVSSEPPITKVEIFSGNLTRLFSNKVYEHTVFVTDGEFADSKNINITVLEANSPPEIEHIPVETIDLNATRQLRKEIKLAGQELGNPESGRFSFTVSDSLNLLEMTIDSNGIINYTASESHSGVHEITVCATDSGAEDTEGKIGVCTPNGLNMTTCKKFQLAVVNGNSPPAILASNSTSLSNRVLGTQKTTFQVFKYDPEEIYPDTYWYVDNQLKQTDAGKSSDKFVYAFGCNVTGKHQIKAVISDGLLNDSAEWALNVANVPCPEGIIPRETIGDATCEEKWGCLDAGICQNALQSKDSGSLETSEYEALNQKCLARGLNEDSCGYQVQTCLDVNDCNTVDKKSSKFIPCHFSSEPNCSDGIQNCHDGKCEFLADCGGPCDPCPTCSDRISNQGEEKIDCGGPCPEQCGLYSSPAETDGNVLFKQGMLFAIFIALSIAIVQLSRIVKNTYELEEQPKRGLVTAHE